MQSDVEADAHVKTTQERKLLKSCTVEELLLKVMLKTCGIVVGRCR
jgi:hypothetical protein